MGEGRIVYKVRYMDDGLHKHCSMYCLGKNKKDVVDNFTECIGLGRKNFTLLSVTVTSKYVDAVEDTERKLSSRRVIKLRTIKNV